MMFIIIPFICSYEKGLVVSFTLAQRVSGGPIGKSSTPLQASDGLVQSQSNGYENNTDGVKVTEAVGEDGGRADKKRKKQKKRKRDKEGKAEEENLEIKLKSKKNSTEHIFAESESKTVVESDAVSQQNNSAATLKDKVLVGVQDLEDVFARFGTVKASLLFLVIFQTSILISIFSESCFKHIFTISILNIYTIHCSVFILMTK